MRTEIQFECTTPDGKPDVVRFVPIHEFPTRINKGDTIFMEDIITETEGLEEHQIDYLYKYGLFDVGFICWDRDADGVFQRIYLDEGE